MSWFKNSFSKSSARRCAAKPAPAAAESPEHATGSTAASTAPTAPAAPAPAAAVAGLPKIAIVTGSTRPGRVNKLGGRLGPRPGGRPHRRRRSRSSTSPTSTSPAGRGIPRRLPELPGRPHQGLVGQDREFDGYIFVANEYNHTVTAGTDQRPVLPERGIQQQGRRHRVLRFHGWRPRRRAPAQHPVRTAGARVRNQVMFSLFTDFENFADFKPTEQNAGTLAPMIDQLIPWAKASPPSAPRRRSRRSCGYRR